MAKYDKYAEYKDSGVEWIGEIPNHWTTCSLSKLFSIKAGGDVDLRNFSEDQSDEYLYPIYTNANDAKSVYGYSKVANYKANSITVSGRGEVGFAVYRNHAFDAIIRLLVLSPQKKCEPKFFAYFINEVINFRVESSAIGQLSTLQISPYKIVLPSLSEQKSVVDYLDNETSKIDSLIEKQLQLIQLLKEKRQAVISHAVTKGLNPNVPMKDSGVEWLGSVPEHWNITTVRNLIRSGKLVLQDGNHGELHPTANDYVEAGIPFLMANNVRNGNLIMGDVKRISKQLADKLRIGFAKAGDMLLTHKGTVGEVALIPLDIKEDYWMLTPQVTYYRWLGKKFFNKYFYYQFQSFSIQSQLEIIGGKQSTRAYVGLIAQGDLVVAIPPINEQLDIASNILEKDKNYQLMIYKAESAIQLMQERRTALISAAVTGKIDVRNWQNPNNNNEAKTELGA